MLRKDYISTFDSFPQFTVRIRRIALGKVGGGKECEKARIVPQKLVKGKEVHGSVIVTPEFTVN